MTKSSRSSLFAGVSAHPPEHAPAMPRGCRNSDWRWSVHHPARLRLVKPCIEVTGTVVWARVSGDGDYKFEPRQEHLVNAHNRSDQAGQLVCEIISADQPGCIAGKPVVVKLGLLQRVQEWFEGPYEFGVCTGAHMTLPWPGAQVRAVGPYVIDLPHGWTEIHPVWSVEVLNQHAR